MVSEADLSELLASASPSDREQLIALGKEACWRSGDLSFKRDRDQQSDHDALWSNKYDDFVAVISRQRGKSYWAVTEASELAVKFPGCSVGYLSKTMKSVYSIVEPRFRQILADCPPDMRPEFNAQRGLYLWPGGSETHLAGTDNKHYDKLRGRTFDFLIKDESGFFDDYEEIDAVLAPQLATTRGICLEISSPPDSAGHPFEARFRAAMARGRAVQRSIYGHPRMSVEDIDQLIAKEAGKRGLSIDEFKKSTYFRREFLAEFVTEETRAAVPGWTAERAKETVIALERPEFFDGYVSLDLGFGDPHGVLFGYWDFPRNALVIEDEILLRQANTEVLANAVKVKEAQLWGARKWEGTLRGAIEWRELPEYLAGSISDDAPGQPYLRVGDNDPLALADLHQKHRVTFMPTAKDQKSLQLDELDIMVRKGHIFIHPRCVNLVRQLFVTIWNKQRTSFERNSDGHGDLVDALVYMVRNIKRNKDPRPQNFGIGPGQRLTAIEAKRQKQNDLGRGLMGDTPLAKRLMARRR